MAIGGIGGRAVVRDLGAALGLEFRNQSPPEGITLLQAPLGSPQFQTEEDVMKRMLLLIAATLLLAG